MEGLPSLPGYTFKDFTRQRHHLPQNFKYKHGFMISHPVRPSIGDSMSNAGGLLYCLSAEPLSYDPSLTYGRTLQKVPSAVKPHFVLYDKKCLAFKAFFKQGVPNSPDEHYRVRHVNIVYFLEDDTMQIAEPVTDNAGYPQGTIVRRCKLPKNSLGEFYHWKDLNNGIDLTANGIVYHVVSCDKWTREYLMSQGVEVNEDEPLPKDPYTDYRLVAKQRKSHKTPSCYDRFYKFLVYDKKVLRFTALWDDRDSLYGRLDKYTILFYLADDTMEIIQVDRQGKVSNSTLMSRRKVPKKWYDPKGGFPSVYLEKTEEDYGEFYTPNDLVIGNTIFVFGRRFMLVDCDKATRDFYNDVLRSEQPQPIQDPMVSKPVAVDPLPKYTGYGSHEDSIQSYYSVVPRPPKIDAVRHMMNAGRILRFTAFLDSERPSNRMRRFVIWYRLSDGHVQVTEDHVPNSGFIGGKFLKYSLIPKQGTDPDNPEYVTPEDFYLGGKVIVFGHHFIIDGADLSVFHYMEANQDKFTEEHISDLRAYLIRKGTLTDNVREIAAFSRREDIAEPVFEEPEDVQPVRRKFQPPDQSDCLVGSRQH